MTVPFRRVDLFPNWSDQWYWLWAFAGVVERSGERETSKEMEQDLQGRTGILHRRPRNRAIQNTLPTVR
jgi:hypothetical protein